MAHLNNIFDLTRNIKSEANLERLRVRNPSTVYTFKKHVLGTKIVSLSVKDRQKLVN
jgi:hypothetical protein